MSRPRTRYERDRSRCRRQSRASVTVSPPAGSVVAAAIIEATIAATRDPGSVSLYGLPPGVTSAAELMTATEYEAVDEELWGKYDQPTVGLTEAEQAEFTWLSGGQS